MEVLPYELKSEITQYLGFSYPSDIDVIRENPRKYLYIIAKSDSVERLRSFLSVYPTMPNIKYLSSDYIWYFSSTNLCLRFLISEGFPIKGSYIIDSLVKIGCLKLLKIALDKMESFDELDFSRGMVTAIETNNIEMLKLLLSYGTNCCGPKRKCPGTSICNVRYFRDCKQNSCQCIAAAVENGAVDCLKLLLDSGCSSDYISFAAVRGNLQCLKLLLATNRNNIDIDPIAIQGTVSRGDYSMLKLLLRYNCIKDLEAVKIAKKKKYMECYNLLLAHGFPCEK